MFGYTITKKAVKGPSLINKVGAASVTALQATVSTVVLTPYYMGYGIGAVANLFKAGYKK